MKAVPCLLLSFLPFGTAVPHRSDALFRKLPDQDDRDLQRDDYTNDPTKACNDFIGRVSTAQLNDCECVPDGRNLPTQCTASCPICTEMGHCGLGRFSGDYRFFTDGVRIQGNYQDVFALTDGPAGTGRVRAKFDNVLRTCEVEAGGEACQSCELHSCSSGVVIHGVSNPVTEHILADCTNIAGGQIFDFCEDITVTDKESKFIVFDKDFKAEYDRAQGCSATSGLLRVGYITSVVFVAFLTILALY